MCLSLRFAIISSKVDKASSLMADILVKEHGFRESGDFSNPVFARNDDLLLFSSKDLLHMDDIDALSPEAYIFLSRHASQSGTPTITSHFPGTVGDDVTHGGRARELAWTYPSLQKCFMQNLWKIREQAGPYDIVIESTHHGPTSMKKPVLFAELGSTEKEWTDPHGASVVCRALAATLDNFSRAGKIGICLGGLHYSEKFTRILAETDIALAGFISKHNLQHVREDTIDSLIAKSCEKVTNAYLDWKGLGQEKHRILQIVEAKNLKMVRV
jgi:D-aminoacyl-tRNA deacylase